MIALYLFLIFVALTLLIEVSLTDNQQAYFQIKDVDKNEEIRNEFTVSLSLYQKMLMTLFTGAFFGGLGYMTFALVNAISKAFS